MSVMRWGLLPCAITAAAGFLLGLTVACRIKKKKSQEGTESVRTVEECIGGTPLVEVPVLRVLY